MMLAVRVWLRRFPQAITLAILLVAWESVSRLFGPQWLPSVTSIAAEWWLMASEGQFTVLASSLQVMAIGAIIMFVIAGVVAIMMASSRLIEEAVNPFINASLATPNIALIPVFTLLWGFSDITRVATIISFGFGPVVVMWAGALKEQPPQLIEMATSFGARRFALLSSVVLPAAAPLLITGVRIGVIQAIKGLISAEVIVGVIGVGKLLKVASLTFNMPGVYAVIFTIVGVSIVSYAVLSWLERRSSRWSG